MRPILQISDPDRSLAFYRTALGMRLISQSGTASDSNVDCYLLAFVESPNQTPARDQAVLELWHDKSTPAQSGYDHSRSDLYWKIGVTLPDIDLACERLRAIGVEVSSPRQFRDIGYLCHLSDPDGYQIELLQWTFEGSKKLYTALPDQPLGQPSTLAHITLRTTDIDACLSFYSDVLGMRQLSRQPVEPFGFTLYFLAYTDETPPNADLEAVENREWLWQRPYGVLELQHLHGPEAPQSLRNHDADALGFRGLSLHSTKGEDDPLPGPDGTWIHKQR